MIKKYIIIGALILTLLIVLLVVIPTVFYKTWGNNEMDYYVPNDNFMAICDEVLWQPPTNCQTWVKVEYAKDNFGN